MLRALSSLALDLHSPEFVELSLPSLLSERAMFGSGHLPRFKNAAYHIDARDLWLAPTAEVAFSALHQGRTVEISDLPERYIAQLTCFRGEAGGGGVASQFRLHQYEQVELFSLCEPSRSIAELQFLLEKAELALRILELRYRVVEFCSGQLPFSSAKAYKLEIFLPISNRWLGVSTVSLSSDFLARRSGIRLAGVSGNRYVHTLNASALACSRIRLALLEYGYNGKIGSRPKALAHLY
jgi:seryl-tRNA synthetase